MFAVIYVKNLSKCRNHMPVLNQFVGIAFILKRCFKSDTFLTSQELP